jgi:Ca2+-binding RTX toxin-like protein
VTFKVDNTQVVAPLTNGSAMISSATLGLGNHTISVTFSSTATLTGKTVSINQKVQNVALEPDPLHPNLTDLFVGGTPATQHIEVRLDHGQVTVDLHNGVQPFQTPLTGLNQLVVFGQADNQQIEVDHALKLPAILFAGNGANAHIQAGGGPTVEVGGAGNDHLEGGTFRDILIAGSGTAHLEGHGGSDILIGGTTNHDNNVAALSAILAEWSNPNESFATRMNNLLGTTATGLNGNYLLNPSTVHDNGHADNLDGDAGMDWYFASSQDQIRDRAHKVVTAIK